MHYMNSWKWIIRTNKKIMKACGLTQIPDRRTGIFDRRLRTISTDIKERIVVMTNHFIYEGMIDPYIVAIDIPYSRPNDICRTNHL